MLAFSPIDYWAFAIFAGAWIGYAIMVELTPAGGHTLNALMNEYRVAWMRRMLDRESRIVDTQIVAALQNGTAFFASTSLIAVGGVLTLLRSSDDVLQIMAALPGGEAPTASSGRRRCSASP